MSVDVKICGLRDAASVDTAVRYGARYTGFVFYKKSPRLVDAEHAGALIRTIPRDVLSVGLFVDADDEEMARVLRLAPLRMLQLHGSETPQRVNAVKKMTGLPVIKAVGISSADDLANIIPYEDVADFLLLDAKPPAGGLPGGNALSFDWSLLKNQHFTKPWMLAGGLTEAIVAAAISTGAPILDVSSGVEDAPGHKNPDKIRSFLKAAGKIETCY